jgi:hypothetical protein
MIKFAKLFSKSAILIAVASLVVVSLLFLGIGMPIVTTLVSALVISLIMYVVAWRDFCVPEPTLREQINGNQTKVLKAPVSAPEIKNHFEMLLRNFNTIEIDSLFYAITSHSNPEGIIAALFSPLDCEQRIKLLKQPIKEMNKLTALEYLISYVGLDLRILKSLFAGLSSEQRIELFIHEYTKSERNILSLHKMTMPILEILFEGMTPEDKLKFLSTETHPGSILLSEFVYSSSYEEGSLDALTFLFKDVPTERLKPLFAHKRVLNKEALRWFSYAPDLQQKGGVTVLDTAIKNKYFKIANLLIAHGALEVDPESDFLALSQSPAVNLTPYRDKLNASLNSLQSLYKDTNVIVSDYVVGEKLESNLLSRKIL